VGTAAADVAAILRGANVVRVHDVAAQIDAVRVADAILRAGGASPDAPGGARPGAPGGAGSEVAP
jgi:dihydropteroate synthase